MWLFSTTEYLFYQKSSILSKQTESTVPLSETAVAALFLLFPSPTLTFSDHGCTGKYRERKRVIRAEKGSSKLGFYPHRQSLRVPYRRHRKNCGSRN
jgi:hypothetical protein